MQLDLFKTEQETLKEELDSIKDQLSNVRRGLFARHNEMAKEILLLMQELDRMKNFIGYKEADSSILQFHTFTSKAV